MSTEFILTAMIVILVPGTGVMYTLAVGLGQGFRSSIVAALGCTFGIVPHILASVVGLAAVLHASAIAFQAVKLLGVVYLLYMAYSILRQGGVLEVPEQKAGMSAGRIITNGVLLNLLNPKLSLFFLAFLPQFIPHEMANPTRLMLSLAGVFMALTFIVFVGYGACASLARDHIISRPSVMTWLRRSFAGVFGALAVKLALTER